MATTKTEGLDVLAFFHEVSERNASKIREEPAYPGSTPPRNQSTSLDSQQNSWLNRLPSHTFSVQGVDRKFYTIGALCMALGKKPVTIRSWESKGWLPKPKFRTAPPVGHHLGSAPKGRRLYSTEQLVFIVETYERFIVVPKNPNWDGFRTHIRQHYPTS